MNVSAALRSYQPYKTLVCTMTETPVVTTSICQVNTLSKIYYERSHDDLNGQGTSTINQRVSACEEQQEPKLLNGAVKMPRFAHMRQGLATAPRASWG